MKITTIVFAALMSSTNAIRASTEDSDYAEVELAQESMDGEMSLAQVSQVTPALNPVSLPEFPYNMRDWRRGLGCRKNNDQLCAGVENCQQCVWTWKKLTLKRAWWNTQYDGSACRCLDNDKLGGITQVGVDYKPGDPCRKVTDGQCGSDCLECNWSWEPSRFEWRNSKSGDCRCFKHKPPPPPPAPCNSDATPAWVGGPVPDTTTGYIPIPDQIVNGTDGTFTFETVENECAGTPKVMMSFGFDRTGGSSDFPKLERSMNAVGNRGFKVTINKANLTPAENGLHKLKIYTFIPKPPSYGATSPPWTEINFIYTHDGADTYGNLGANATAASLRATPVNTPTTPASSSRQLVYDPNLPSTSTPFRLFDLKYGLSLQCRPNWTPLRIGLAAKPMNLCGSGCSQRDCHYSYPTTQKPDFPFGNRLSWTFADGACRCKDSLRSTVRGYTGRGQKSSRQGSTQW